jgi:hypothetical protein
MYYLIGTIYAAAMVLLITIPILLRIRIIRVAQQCKGKVFSGHYEISTISQNLLTRFHSIKREALIVIYLDAGHRCLDVSVRFGDKENVHFPAKDIYDRAVALKAAGVVIARNHVDEKSAPSDKDVFHAASVHGVLGGSIDLAGYFVWCHQRAQSVLNTHRYLQMIEGIRSE